MATQFRNGVTNDIRSCGAKVVVLGDAPGDADRVESRTATGVGVGGGIADHRAFFLVDVAKLGDRGDDAFGMRFWHHDIVSRHEDVDVLARS